MKNIHLLKPYTKQLIVLSIASFASIAILCIGYVHYSNAQLKNEQAIALQGRLNQEIHQLIENKFFLDSSRESFNRIKSRGFFGEEDRLSWGEVLKTTAQRLKLPNLKYSIHPQQQLHNIGSDYSSALLLSESIMDIEADLLHENDFIELSEQLSRMPGLFRVLGCELTKEKEIILNEPHKNINLKCTLAWYTVKHAPVDDGEILDDEFDTGLI